MESLLVPQGVVFPNMSRNQLHSPLYSPSPLECPTDSPVVLDNTAPCDRDTALPPEQEYRFHEDQVPLYSSLYFQSLEMYLFGTYDGLNELSDEP